MGIQEDKINRVRSDRPVWWLIAAVAGLNVIVAAYVAHMLGNSRHLYEVRAEQGVRNIGLALEKEIAGIVRSSDLLLQVAIDEFYRQRASGAVDPEKIKVFVDRLIKRYPVIDGIRFTDDAGMLRFGTGISPGKPIDLSDRPHFKTLLDTEHDELVISRPQLSRANNKQVIVLARRLNSRDGSFAGMAFLPLTVSELADAFLQVGLDRGSTLSLHRLDSSLIAAHPIPASVRDDEADVRVDIPAPALDLLARGTHQGAFVSASALDGREQLTAFQRVGDYPLFLLIGRSRQEYLAPWRTTVRSSIVVVVCFMLVTLGLSWRIYAGWVRNRQVSDELAHLAKHDFLTGLLNRRAFLEQAENEWHRIRRYQTPASLLMLDIDHFKQINDTCGHRGGDVVLQKLADILRATVRDVDLVCRWGGEEFIALLPETTSPGARELAERLRLRVEETAIDCGAGPNTIRMTVSIGVVSVQTPTERLETLIAQADQALYRAKNGGRNRASA